MRLAVISDSHDHIPNLRAAVALCNEQAVSLLIHCGDLISPFMLQELANFNGPVHLIYGNNVGDLHLILSLCHARFPTITHHGIRGAVEAGGRRIAFHHYPELARGLCSGGNFDIVCCGHNHTYRVEMRGHCLFVNPGELLGKDGQPTFCIVDTDSLTTEKINIGTPLFQGDANADCS